MTTPKSISFHSLKEEEKYEASSGEEPRGFIENYCVMLIALFRTSAAQSWPGSPHTGAGDAEGSPLRGARVPAGCARAGERREGGRAPTSARVPGLGTTLLALLRLQLVDGRSWALGAVTVGSNTLD